MYIAEAALEYFISLLVTGAFIAKLTADFGFSDSLTAVLISFVALGCSFQLFAVFFHDNQLLLPRHLPSDIP